MIYSDHISVFLQPSDGSGDVFEERYTALTSSDNSLNKGISGFIFRKAGGEVKAGVQFLEGFGTEGADGVVFLTATGSDIQSLDGNVKVGCWFISAALCCDDKVLFSEWVFKTETGGGMVCQKLTVPELDVSVPAGKLEPVQESDKHTVTVLVQRARRKQEAASVSSKKKMKSSLGAHISASGPADSMQIVDSSQIEPIEGEKGRPYIFRFKNSTMADLGSDGLGIKYEKSVAKPERQAQGLSPDPERIARDALT